MSSLEIGNSGVNFSGRQLKWMTQITKHFDNVWLKLQIKNTFLDNTGVQTINGIYSAVQQFRFGLKQRYNRLILSCNWHTEIAVMFNQTARMH